MGEYDAAIKNFQIALQQDGNPCYDLGQLYFELGQYENAVKSIQRMQRKNRSYIWFPQRPIQYSKSFYLLGKIYEEKGDSKLAIKNYETFLDIWKNADEDLPDLIEAKKRLANLKGVL